MDTTDIDLIVIIKALRHFSAEYAAMPLSARGTLTLLAGAGMLALSEPMQTALERLQTKLEESEDFKLFREAHAKKGD